MEQPREPQPPVGPASYPYPYAAPYAQPYAQPAPRPSAWRVFSSFLRLLLRRFLYAIVWVLRPLRSHILFAIVTIALLSVIGWMSYTIWGSKSAASADPRVAVLEPAPAIQNYLTGRKTYNADLMWEAFSNNYQARQLQNGGSKSTMQSVARQEKRLGLEYRKIQYIGGVKLDDGGHMYNYSVDVVVNKRTFRLPVVFMSDREEKIEYIISPLDDIIQQLSQ